MKNICTKCGKMAVWLYMPADGQMTHEERFYCEDCVSRGCSCNEDFTTGEQITDEIGRLLPCCEYDYSEHGYEIEE